MRTRNAEAPKSGPNKKTLPLKNTAAASKPAPKSASGPKAAAKVAVTKQSTPKPTPNSEPESKAEGTTNLAGEQKLESAVNSAEKKVGAKPESPIGQEASVDPLAKPEDTIRENPSPNVEELDSKENGKEVEAEEPIEEDAEPIENEEGEGAEGDGGFEEPGDEEVADEEGEGGEVEGGDAAEDGDDMKVEDEEQIEISDMAKARKIKKEKEIFVGGLDRDAVEEDLRNVFEKFGEVIEIRLHKDFATNKNKGFAFVKFADKVHASKALTELKNPVIRGKRCGIAPSEDNDTLFLGNICNTWTKEAVKRKLKDYGIDNVEGVTLVEDTKNEGLSRGFAFLEFSCHEDASLAYKRLQKPDVVFGHPERTAKVAFAEPLRDPDPEIMAEVKSVFVDGLPPYWDEDRVKEQFKDYGEIERVVLARNMSSARRKDFGFVYFMTHEEAVACVEGLNNTELGDGKSMTKIRARLANPLPKTQAVKGGMRGGFRIGHSGFGFHSRFGRGSGRGRYPSNRAGLQGGRGFYLRGRGRGGRFSFVSDNVESPSSEFRGMSFGVRGGGRVATGGRRGAFDRGRGRAFPLRRQSFSAEENFSVPFNARYLDQDPYFYGGGGGHGIKRPFSMMEHDFGYLESGSRLRPQYDHPDSVPDRYQGSLGRSGLYSHDFYGSDYGGSTYSSAYGGEHSGGGYYY